MKKLKRKFFEWVKNHIIADVPPHLEELFDGKKEIELWECATCGTRGVCQHCIIHRKDNITN
tara:strand:+ start:226 stop:411 length:186 start_codon:yes stop_codon:yes gene_type:complete